MRDSVTAERRTGILNAKWSLLGDVCWLSDWLAASDDGYGSGMR